MTANISTTINVYLDASHTVKYSPGNLIQVPADTVETVIWKSIAPLQFKSTDFQATSIVNTGEVCYSDTEDTTEPPVVVCDESSVTVNVPQPLAGTGVDGAIYAWAAGFLTLLGGMVVALTALRRRSRSER